MQYPLADLCDRFTILLHKVQKLPEDNSVSEAFGIFTQELDCELSKFNKDKRLEIEELIKQLYEKNGEIWMLEADLRAGNVDEDRERMEIGRRAILIRNKNRERLSIKNKIAILAIQMFSFDKKINHVSE